MVVFARGHVVIDQGARRGGIKTQLSDTETGGHGGKGRDRHEYGFGIRQVKHNALHHFGKGQVTRSIVGDDVHQHDSPFPHASRSMRYPIDGGTVPAV